mmetsp:Transcript_101294/g.201259  ORF Transcript_101294/g.201259 Transcript_101294/m.201259 type:complete len:207 (-) Transcript_101294:523-1143(-)
MQDSIAWVDGTRIDRPKCWHCPAFWNFQHFLVFSCPYVQRLYPGDARLRSGGLERQRIFRITFPLGDFHYPTLPTERGCPQLECPGLAFHSKQPIPPTLPTKHGCPQIECLALWIVCYAGKLGEQKTKGPVIVAIVAKADATVILNITSCCTAFSGHTVNRFVQRLPAACLPQPSEVCINETHDWNILLGCIQPLMLRFHRVQDVQ